MVCHSVYECLYAYYSNCSDVMYRVCVCVQVIIALVFSVSVHNTLCVCVCVFSNRMHASISVS